MRTLFKNALAALLVTGTAPATAQVASPQLLCQDDLANDKQGAFKIGPDGLTISNDTIELREDKRLQLKTDLKKLDSENITFPFDQTVTIDYVYESAGASHSLGYMYLDDVKARGYADANGNLVDKNANGVLDLHEALYNLTPDDDPILPVKYVGKGPRRCSRTFTSGGKTYMEPELAMGPSPACTKTFVHKTDVTDSRPGRADSSNNNIANDWVGTSNSTSSDNGLFPHIPNLLEPAAPENDYKGLGRMVFLLADDDDGKTVERNLGPVADISNDYDGIPDYNVSQYDYRGLKLPAPATTDPEYTNYNNLNTGDRRVNLGMVQGGKEIVFFAVVYYDVRHNTDNDTVAPCLKRAPYTGNADEDGKCLLHLQTSVSVFFSKATWNLDQNFKTLVGNKVTERNIGCSYSESCNVPSDGDACEIENSGGQRACGWLEQATLDRLASPAYNTLIMPPEGVTIMRPGTESGNVSEAVDRMNYMPHVIVGAPTTDPFRWILGFEDLNGGGDRDFNDIVFMINKENGGGAKSNTVTSDVMGDDGDRLGPDFTITKVRFRRQDDVAPYSSTETPPPASSLRVQKPGESVTKCPGNGAPCWTEEAVGACTPPSGIRPTITYSIAVDCRILDGNGKYQPNPSPGWVPVVFPTGGTYPTQEVEIDILALGLTGSQLCWKVDISSPNEQCRPIIDDVDIGYQAVRSGAYARSSPSTLGNVAVWGVNETPGQKWGEGWSGAESSLPLPGIRTYDGAKDYTIRGRMYLQSLYDPEKSDATNPKLRWEAGRVMALSITSGDLLDKRKLYTMSDSNGGNKDVKDKGNELFAGSLCNTYSEIDGRYPYDLNHDDNCSPGTERKFLVDWLYGYENKTTGARRPWPMGGINLSTVALAVPPYQDNWYQYAKPTERDLYRTNFLKGLEKRKTVAYVGTMSGVLHAFDTGDFRNALKDGCVDEPQQRGYFEPTGCGSATVPATRAYGTGKEEFAYMPELLLGQYRNQYVRFRNSGTLPRPQMDASPSIANVDLGDRNDWNSNIKYDWKPAQTAQKQQGAKTVLVSATGKSTPVVYALDITNPEDDWYPLPLWEFSFKDLTMATAFTAAQTVDPQVLLPDNIGSRHAPSLVRAAWGSANAQDRRWVAVVGTDYEPAEKRAGAVFLLDMKTGKPLDYGSTPGGKYAGVITFEKGWGIAAESAMLDLDQDGTYDVMYVPTTSGSVWRVNLKNVSTSRKLGDKVQKCMVASAPAALKNHPDASQTDLDLQQLYSNLAVKLVRTENGTVVRFYFGTGDNPDQYTDGYDEPNPASPSYQYHLMAFEDPNPAGDKPCLPLEPMWVQKLGKGEKLWGGVALSADSVYAATAAGKAADICNLSTTQNGASYTANQITGVMTRSELEGHAISAPVVHDEHLFVLTATGKMKVMGGQKWNNKAGASGVPKSQIMLWEPLPDGRLPQ
ncbi:DUF4114 domain-containing protein [Corallococcus sp. CA047B]|uniref:DUF4114 domain-containing protein n=1 Tax=Corallococcus sp. CA047B TaxID=2316729 RepID=UPI000EA23B3E|nr:DUF4114 domain-containing protein [Corallococcus sp. CA047B]RKH15757.1 DUF4114 domain-containing protein [Corallococcus sp. CA047B]